MRRALLRNNKSEQKMEKDKKDKTPRQLGKAAAEKSCRLQSDGRKRGSPRSIVRTTGQERSTTRTPGRIQR